MRHCSEITLSHTTPVSQSFSLNVPLGDAQLAEQWSVKQFGLEGGDAKDPSGSRPAGLFLLTAFAWAFVFGASQPTAWRQRQGL
jgi:hypothetical protein